MAARRKSDRFFSTRSPSTLSLNQSVGEDLHALINDQKIKSDPLDNKNRRTIVVKRVNGSFGFTLQTYGLHRQHSDEVNVISYVDYVELTGPAYQAGMREGDVILSINGKSVENVDHMSLVECIKNCDDSMRMVVLFEDIRRKIELHKQYNNLKQVLAAKLSELRSLAEKEASILQKVGATGGPDFSFADVSSSFSSIYFDGDSILLADQGRSTSSVFQSSADCSPGATSCDTAKSPSPGLLCPYSAPAGATRSALPSEDDAFWSSNSGYGSLPVRSNKRKIKRNNSASRGTTSSRWHVDHPRVTSILFEEGDGGSDYQSATEAENGSASLSTGSDTSPRISINVSEHDSLPVSTPLKPKSKLSGSVPNLLKLKITNSPFMPRRMKSSATQPDTQKILSKGDTSHTMISRAATFRDPRQLTKQVKQQIANYVITEDCNRKSDDPQLVGLRQLCNDFRNSCIEQTLKSRRRSIELLISKGYLRPVVNCSSNRMHVCQEQPIFETTEHSDVINNLSNESASHKPIALTRQTSGFRCCDNSRHLGKQSECEDQQDGDEGDVRQENRHCATTAELNHVGNNVTESDRENSESRSMKFSVLRDVERNNSDRKVGASESKNSTECSTESAGCVNLEDEVTWL